MSELDDVLKRVAAFDELGHVEKIKVFGWYLHSVEQRPRFSGQDILRCYDSAGIQRPTNVANLLQGLGSKNPPQILRDRNGYSLERRVRLSFDQSLGTNAGSIQVNKLIADLPALLTSSSEQAFFDEVLICYRYGAFRAAIIMTWNLVYSHFCEWILRHHAAAFNTQWPVRFPEQHKKAKVKVVSTLDHFGELKESEVIDIARSAGLVSQSIHKALIEKLGKRNTAAHPSTHVFMQVQVEEFIHDLIVNVVHKLV